MADKINKLFEGDERYTLTNTSPQNLSKVSIDEQYKTPGTVFLGDLYKDESKYDEDTPYLQTIEPGGIERRRHEEQSAWSSLGNAGVQAITTTVGQLMQDVGYLLDPEMAANILKGSEKEWGNWLTDAGSALIESGQNIAPIYQDPDKEGGVNMGDWTWWMANLPSAVASAAFFLPGLGAAKLAGAAVKLAKLGKLGAGAARVGSGIIGGLINRYGESAMEAGQVADEFESMVGQPITFREAKMFKDNYGVDATLVKDPETGASYYTISPEVAREAGAKAAANTFKANQALAGFDIAQIMFATTPFGAVTKNLTGKVAKALGKSGAAAMGKNFAGHLLNAGSEGIEEGIQYVASNESKNAELVRMGLMDESTLSEKSRKYMEDGELFTSMIIGSIGGGMMGGLGRALQTPFSKRKGEISESDARVANINSWAGQMKAVTNAMAKAEQDGNMYAFEAFKLSTSIKSDSEAAQHGNLGHRIDALERAKEDPEIAKSVFGIETEADKKAFDKNVDDYLRIARNIESAFQSNVNKTGNWALSNSLTSSEIIKSELGRINNNISKEIEANLASDDLFDVDVNTPSDKKNISSDYKNRVVATAELAQWRLEQSKVEKRLKDLLAAGQDVNSYGVKLAEKHVEAVKSRIANLEKSLDASRENYTDAQFKQDQNYYKPKTSETRKSLVRNINQRVTTESDILDNDGVIDFLNTEEGKAVFDKTRYEVKRKKATDKVNNATTVQEVADELDKDDTGAAAEAVDKATVTPPPAPTTTPVTTEATPEVTPEEPERPINQEEVDRTNSLLGGITEDPAVKEAEELFSRMSPAAKMLFAKKAANVNNYDDVDLDEVDNLLGLIQEYRVTKDPELLDVIKKSLAIAKQELVKPVEPTTNGDTIDNNNPESKIAEVDTFNTDEGWKTFIFKGASLINTVFGYLRSNKKLISGIAEDMVTSFGIPPNSKLSIVWDKSNKYKKDSRDERVYYLVYNDGKTSYRIAALPPYYPSNMRRPVDGKPLSAADEKYNNDIKLVGELRAKLDIEFNQHADKDKSMVSSMSLTIAGYNAEYNSEPGKGHTVNGSKLSKLRRSTDNSHIANTITESGGFVVGIVDKNDNAQDSTLIDFKGVNDTSLQGKHDKLLSKNIPLRRKMSQSYRQTVDGMSNVVVKYYMPYNEQFVMKVLGSKYSEKTLAEYLEANGYVFEKEFLPEDAYLAEIWLNSMYEKEAGGSIYIASHNPMTENEALLMRAWYVPNSDLQGPAKKVVWDFIYSTLKSGGDSAKVLATLKKYFVLSTSDKAQLDALLKDKSVKDLPWDNIDSAPSESINLIKQVLTILGTSHIKIEKTLFNKPKGWTGSHKFITSTEVPFNTAVQSFIKTQVNQDAPFREVQPIIHAIPSIDKPVEVKVPEVSSVAPVVPPVTVEEVKEVHEELKNVSNAIDNPVETKSEVIEVQPNSIQDVVNNADSGYLDDMLDDSEEEDAVEKEFKLRQSTETVTEGSKEELEWFAKYFPNIPVKDLEEIRDYIREVTKSGNTAWGAFTNSAVYIAKNFPTGTVYHEAFHVVFNLAFNDKQRAILMSQAPGETALDKEEWLAEKFREVMLSKADKAVGVKGVVAKYLRQLKLFIRSVLNTNVNNLEELAYRVQRGKYKNLKPTQFDVDSIKLFKKVSDWDWFKTRRAVNAINALVVNDVIPTIRTSISTAYNQAVAKNDTALVNKLKGLGYHKVNDLSVAELMQFWKEVNGGDKYAVYNTVYTRLMSRINADGGNALKPATRSKLLSLVSEMYKDGNPTTLVTNALAVLNKANGVIMVTKGVKNAEGLEDTEEVTQERQSEVYEVNFITKPRASEISPMVKNVLRHIPKLTKDGKKVFNEFGLSDFYDFDIIDQAIIKDVSGSLTPAEIITKLQKNLSMHPEYQYVINKMLSDKAFAISMHQAYNRPIMAYQMIYKVRNWVNNVLTVNSTIIDSGTIGVSGSLTSLWYNTFSNESPVVQDGVINKLYGNAGELVSAITRDHKGVMWKVIDSTATEADYALVIKSLNNLGITGITEDLLKAIVASTTKTKLQNMVRELQLMYDDISDGRNPYINSKAIPSVGRNPFIKTFADLVAKSSPHLYEPSHMNIDGEKVFSYVIPSFVHRFMHNVTTPAEAKELLKRYTSDPLFSGSSKVVDNVIKEGTTNNIILDKIIKVLTTITDPAEQELALQEIVRIGVIEGIKEKDSDGRGYTGMFDADLKEAQLDMFFNSGNAKGVFKLVPLSDSPNMLGVTMDKMSMNEGLAALVKVAQGEFDRIQAIAKALETVDKRKLITNYHTKANATTDTGFRILPMLNGKVTSAPVNNSKGIIEILDAYYSKAATDYANKLVEYGIIEVKNGNVTSSKINNNIIAAYPTVEDFRGFIKTFLINYTANVSAFTTLTIGDPAFYKEKVKNGKIIDPLIVDYFKRAKEMFSPKSNPSVDQSETYRTINIQDVEGTATSLEAIKASITSLVESGKISQKTADDIIEGYNDVNWTDAQAFITPQFYKRTMEDHGLWTANLEEVYNRIMEGRATTEDFEVFQPIKPFMYDHMYNTEHGVMVPTQNKNSEFVLFPAFVENNPKLKAIYDMMASKEVDVVNYHSAVKAGLTNIVTMQEIEEGAVADESVNTQFMANRGIQQATPEHHIDATGKHGSQVRVIVISALDYTKDENGNPNTMYNVDGVTKSAEDIVDEYQELIVSNLKDSYDILKNEFLTNGDIDWKKVSDILVAHAESNMMSDDFIDALKLNPATGKMYLPMFDPIFSDKFDSLLSAMVRNRVTNQKIAQMSLIQASSVGLNDTLKLVFKDDKGRMQFDKDLVESEKFTTFAKLQQEDSEAYDSLVKKGYTEEMWNTLTEEEKEHAKKCAKV